jgi:predicted O-methyltransferase YrrM
MDAITITDPRVENYLYAVLPARDAVLREMEKQAAERDIPIVGPAVARLLYQYARLINAKTVFEMGSAIGYSTIRKGTLHRRQQKECRRSARVLRARWGGR